MADVLSAVVNGVFGVLILILGVRLSGRVKRQEQKVDEVRSQVVNDHSTNLREEGDTRHEENTSKLDQIIEIVEALETSVSRLWKRSDHHDDQIEEITQERSRFAPKAKHRMEIDQ